MKKYRNHEQHVHILMGGGKGISSKKEGKMERVLDILIRAILSPATMNMCNYGGTDPSTFLSSQETAKELAYLVC